MSQLQIHPGRVLPWKWKEKANSQKFANYGRAYGMTYALNTEDIDHEVIDTKINKPKPKSPFKEKTKKKYQPKHKSWKWKTPLIDKRWSPKY